MNSKKQSIVMISALTIVVIVTYGLAIGWFSFYGDDWIYIYNQHLMGADSFPVFVSWDRPFSAWIYMLTGTLFGEAVLPYHLLILFQRWLAVVLFWLVLRMVWKNEQRITLFAALIFAVYPGFQQQPIAVQFILHFASLDLCLFSLYCMLCAVRANSHTSRWAVILWTLAGFFSSALALFSCEYFVGLEALRLLLLFFVIWNGADETGANSVVRCISKLFRYWWPYLLSAAAFLIWRVFIFSFQTYQPEFLDKLSADAGTALPELFVKVVKDLKVVLLDVWRAAVRFPANQADLLRWMLTAAAIFVLVLLLRCCFSQSESATDEDRRTAFQILLCGLLTLLASGVPFWATMIDVMVSFPWDRSTLSFSPAVALIFAALIWLFFKEKPQWLVVAGLTALAAAYHFSNALIYRNEAQKMNDYFWQLAWRAPALEQGTILISDDIPLNRYSDSDLSPVVNWQYAPELRGNTYQYKYFDLDLREKSFFSDLSTTQSVSHTYRSHQFFSDNDHVLAIYFREGQCLHIITADESGFPGLPESLVRTSQISDPSLILIDSEVSAIPPQPIGSEPTHGFCYYYQKADLALQAGDWALAGSLAGEAIQQNLQPGNALDWIPLIRALFEAQDWQTARNVLSSLQFSDYEQAYFCEQIQHTQSDLSPLKGETLGGCTF